MQFIISALPINCLKSKFVGPLNLLVILVVTKSRSSGPFTIVFFKRTSLFLSAIVFVVGAQFESADLIVHLGRRHGDARYALNCAHADLFGCTLPGH